MNETALQHNLPSLVQQTVCDLRVALLSSWSLTAALNADGMPRSTQEWPLVVQSSLQSLARRTGLD